MRKLISLFLVVATVFGTLPQQAFAAIIPPGIVAGGQTPGFFSTTNYVKNPSAILNLQNVTASGGSLTRTTTTPIEGKGSFLIQASAAAQTYDWAVNDFDTGLYGQNCEASLIYRGVATAYDFRVRQNSVDITAPVPLVDASTNSQIARINFPCGNGSTPTVVRVTSTASGSAVRFARVYVGLATNLSAGVSFLPTTVQVLTASSGTYTTPANVRRIRVRMVGGGGGGAGSSQLATANGSPGGDGGNTTFGTSILTANGGKGALMYSAINGSTGGTATVTGGAIQLVAVQGGSATSTGLGQGSQATIGGGTGAASPFGGSGGGGYANQVGRPAIALSGSGGGGAGTPDGTGGGYPGGGGAAGGYVDAIINSPAGSYPYTVGSAGSGGLHGTNGFDGGSGGSGVIIVEEEYYAAGTAFGANQTLDSLGAIVYAASSTCPTGSIPADGSAVSRTTYAQLFSRISTTYGVGDGSTTFNVPDLRGIFVRGVGSQTISSITYTGVLATKQGDQEQGHYHLNSNLTGTGEIPYKRGSSGVYADPFSAGTVYDRIGPAGAIGGTITTDGTNGTPRVGSETRPANIGMTACISVATANAPLLVNSVVTPYTGVTTVNSLINYTTTHTATTTEETIAADTTSAAWTLTLPPASSVPGKKYTAYMAVGASNTNALTIVGSGGDLVCEASSIALVGRGDTITLQSTGTKWVEIDGRPCTRSVSAVINNVNGAQAITYQSGAWLGAGGCSGTGQCVFNFTAGVFSARPACTCSANLAAAAFCAAGVVTSGSTTVITYNTVPAQVNETGVSLICEGPR